MSKNELPRFDLMSEADVRALPPPTWLIENVLATGTFGILIGPPGSGKSFVALDMALSVACGIAWMGRETVCQQGSVLYIAAEGRGGTGNRLRAWRHVKRQAATIPCSFVLQPLPLMSRDMVTVLGDRVETTIGSPVLIVIDTMARCMAGGDENAFQYVSRFVMNCDSLRERFGATMLIVHHTPKHSAGTGRGSGALDGAVDTSLELRPRGGKPNQPYRRLQNLKQKDAEAHEDVLLRITPVEGTDSCVMVPVDEHEYRSHAGGDEDRPPAQRPPSAPPEALERALEALRSFGEAGASEAEWQSAFTLKTNESAAVWRRARTALRQAGRIVERRGRAWVR